MISTWAIDAAAVQFGGNSIQLIINASQHKDYRGGHSQRANTSHRWMKGSTSHEPRTRHAMVSVSQASDSASELLLGLPAPNSVYLVRARVHPITGT